MIIVAGEALIDLILDADGHIEAVPGGGSYTTARTIGRLGLPVAFVVGLSTDRFGEWLRDGLRRDGVDDGYAVSTDAPTTLAIAELDADGTASYRFHTAGTSAVALSRTTLPALPASGVDAVHVGGLGLVLEPLASAVEGIVDVMPSDALVMVDPNCRPATITDRPAYTERLERVLARADVVKVSTDDLAFLWPDRAPRDAARWLLERGPRVVLWTDGPGAVHAVGGGFEVALEPPVVRVVDTVGAGDAFGGGFLAAWVGAGNRRADLGSAEAVRAATASAVTVAAITCTRAGAAPPTAAELAAWRDDR